MATLAIDTSLAQLGLALHDPVTGKTAVFAAEIGIGHAERIAPAVADLLADWPGGASGVERIVVTIGPGSFMGVRVGIGFARGFAFARALPIIPVTSLAALALAAPDNAAGWAVIDARRGEVYAMAFGPGADPVPCVLSYAAAAELIPPDALLIGNGAAAIGRAPAPGLSMWPDMQRLAAAGHHLPEGEPIAAYLRAPDAKPSRPIL